MHNEGDNYADQMLQNVPVLPNNLNTLHEWFGEYIQGNLIIYLTRNFFGI